MQQSASHITSMRFQLISIMLGFFAMGAIEMVGIASNYIKVALHISDVKANMLPFLTYIWFLICTIPTGILMQHIGRKRCVVLTLSIMLFAMVIGLFSTSYPNMILCFVLLGIGNVSLQTALYQLVSFITEPNILAERLTVGQLVKTFSSFSAPYIAMLGALYFIHFFDLKWRFLFLYYLIVLVLTIALFLLSSIRNERDKESALHLTFLLRLLKKRFILLSFLAVMFHVGIDVSVNTLSPKLLMIRCGDLIEKASLGSGMYFLARLLGCFSWSLLIGKLSRKTFFYISVLLIFGSIIPLFFIHNKELIYLFIAMIGFGNANLFPVIFSLCVVRLPAQKSILSTLMIMAQGGGAIIPLIMGVAFDWIGLNGAIAVLLLSILYLMYYVFRVNISDKNKADIF